MENLFSICNQQSHMGSVTTPLRKERKGKTMPENVVREETLYTYEAAINRYERERHHDYLCRQKQLKAIRAEQKARRTYFRNQRLLGLLMVVLSLVLMVLAQEGLAVFGIIAGAWVMVTKKMVVYNEYYRTHGGADQWK